MLCCYCWVLLVVKRLFHSLSIFVFFSLSLPLFFLPYSKPIFGPLQTGTSILVLVSATWRWRRFLKWVACTTLGVAVHFCGLLSFFRLTFLLFPLMFFSFCSVFWFISVYVFCFFFSSCTMSFGCFSFRYLTIFLFLVFGLFFSLSKRQASLNVPSLLLCFTVRLSIYSIYFLAFLVYVHCMYVYTYVTEWTRISCIPRCKLI